MKTTAKTVFSFVSAGMMVLAANYSSQAQSASESKPLSPQVQKILCERFPLNSRCAQGGSAVTPSAAPSESLPISPSGGGALSPTTPTDSAPTAPTSSDPVSPTGGGMLPPTSPSDGTTVPQTDSAPSAPTPQAEPDLSDPQQPPGPSSAAPVSTPIAQMPTTPATQGGEAPAASPSVGSDAATESGTILGTVAGSENLKTLATAVKAAGLESTLDGTGPFTVFAPTDAAFAALPPGTLETLLKPENKDKLTKLLTYHVVSGKLSASSLKTGSVATVAGLPISVKVQGQQVSVNDAKVVQPDISATNGVIYLIDKVIVPSS